MSQAKNNDTVTLIYEGKLDNGEVFKTVSEDKPLTIILGNGDAPPALEQALLGMKAGERAKIRVPPDESYGPRQKDLLQELDVSVFGNAITPKPGMILSLNVEKEGAPQKVPATVLEVGDGKVTVDYNHPLAGHHLNYDLTVIGITKGS